jgi:predicted O-methyltransferase YrrM
MANYHFSQNWFDNDIPNIELTLKEYIGKPIKFLEIGSFEGRSTVWFLTHVLTHPDATITCIDWFSGSPEHYEDNIDVLNIAEIFKSNINQTGVSEKVTNLVGKSQELLRTLPIDNYNIVYIDGSHTASDVLEDAVLSFRLLKSGGIMMFDDYEWSRIVPEVKKPKLGIDSFLAAYAGQYDLLFKKGQVYICKH